MLAGPGVGDNFDYVDAEIPSAEAPDAFTSTSPIVGGIDWQHMMASVSAYVCRGASTSQVGPEFSDIGS